MNLTVTKEAFLSDPKNKQRFIDFLGAKLTNQGCQVFYDQADADLLIVQKTIESALARINLARGPRLLLPRGP